MKNQVRRLRARATRVCVPCLVLAWAGAARAAFVPSGFQAIDLGTFGADADYDARRGVIYVSNPARNEVAVVSVTTRQVIDHIPIAGGPQGIDLTDDGRFLYAALDPPVRSRESISTRAGKP